MLLPSQDQYLAPLPKNLQHPNILPNEPKTLASSYYGQSFYDQGWPQQGTGCLLRRLGEALGGHGWGRASDRYRGLVSGGGRELWGESGIQQVALACSSTFLAGFSRSQMDQHISNKTWHFALFA